MKCVSRETSSMYRRMAQNGASAISRRFAGHLISPRKRCFRGGPIQSRNSISFAPPQAAGLIHFAAALPSSRHYDSRRCRAANRAASLKPPCCIRHRRRGLRFPLPTESLILREPIMCASSGSFGLPENGLRRPVLQSVIANQSADWCGNPYSPSRGTRSAGPISLAAPKEMGERKLLRKPQRGFF